MSIVNIIDTDDETIYTEEDIDLLCREEEDLLKPESVILKREKEGRRKLYKKVEVKNILEDIELGQKILNKYKLAIKTNTPEKLVFLDKENIYFSIREKLKEGDILDNLKFFKNEYSLNIDEFILAYYFTNIYKPEKYIIENLNRISKLSNITFNLEEWKLKTKAFDNIFKNRMEKTKKEYKKISDFYNEINTLPFSNNPDEISKNFKLEQTKINAQIRKENFYFDIDSGEIIFDELSVNKNFPYIQYNSYDQKYYKIYDNNLDIENLLIAKDNLFEDLKENEEVFTNKIYIICRLEIFGKYSYIILIINLEKSDLTFEYPYNTSYKIYTDLKKLIPGLKIKDEKIINLSGSFEFKIDNYNELNFYYLTLFDDKISNFIYVNENKRPRSLMKNIKYYYKNYTENYLDSAYNLTFNFEKLYINKYLVKFKTKFEEKDDNINEFILILSKLVYYYENYDFKETDLQIILNPYTGKDGDGLGDNLNVEDLKLNKVSIKGNKLTNLLSIAPEIFPVNSYGRKCLCPNQPIIVEDEDFKDWSEYLKKESINVYPPRNSIDKDKKSYIFACPTDDLVLNYIINPDSKSPFPILPCCSQTVKNDYYENYDKIKKDPENYFNLKADTKVVVSKNILKNINPLASDQKGNIPLSLKNFLKDIYPTKNFYRYGVNKNSKSSFFHCCLISCNHLETIKNNISNKRYIKNIKYLLEIAKKYKGLNISEKDLLVDKLKNKISEEDFIKINKEIISQELYNFDNDSINYLLENNVFDSKYFYKLMEYLYFVNIFVFVFKDGNIKLEKPNHRFYHHREYRMELPTLILFKHEDGRIPIYEIIMDNENALYDNKLLTYMKNYIEDYGYYVAGFKDNDYKITKNFFSNINMNYILKDYFVLGQFINDSGRAYALNIKYGIEDSDIMTIFICSSFPLDVPKAYRIYKTTKENVFKLFGKKYIEGSEGFWYSLNNKEKEVFIPVVGIKTKEKDICIPYVTNEKRRRGLNKFNKINTIKKNSKIIIQIIIYIWNLSKDTDLDSWFNYYISIGDKKAINNFCNNNIFIEYRFKESIKTPEEAIEYFSDYIPVIFGKDTIFLYEELEEAVYRYLKSYISKTEGYGKIKNDAIVDIFKNESDFTERLNNRLIIGEKNYDDYSNFLQSENKDFLNLDNNLNTRKRGFLYKNKQGNVFIIQNNIYNNLKVSILTSKVWDKIKYNLGYDTTNINIWKKIEEDYRLLEALELSSEEIILTANKYSNFFDIEIQDLYEALDYLYRNKIEIELKEDDYNYITINYMEYINKENFKSSNPYNLFSYENQAYASMLNIG